MGVHVGFIRLCLIATHDCRPNLIIASESLILDPLNNRSLHSGNTKLIVVQLLVSKYNIFEGLSSYTLLLELAKYEKIHHHYYHHQHHHLYYHQHNYCYHNKCP